MSRMTSTLFSAKLLLCVVVLFGTATFAYAQLPTAASPARWVYPDGNSEATRNQPTPSAKQNLDSVVIKWSTNAIAGDVRPLIGNIINNNKLSPNNPFAPLEIAAVIGGKLVIVDATGRNKPPSVLPPFVRSVSVLLDSASLPQQVYSLFPSLIGLESIENAKPVGEQDSIAYSYIAGYDTTRDSIVVLKRLALDVRPYDPNLFAGIKPVFGRPLGNQVVISAIVSMSNPTIPSIPSITPFFRGLTVFPSGSFIAPYVKEVGDTIPVRYTVGPDVSFSQPSVSSLTGGKYGLVFPNFPGQVDFTIPDPLNSLSTYVNRPYLMGLELQGATPAEAIVPIDLDFLSTTGQTSTRPRIKPYYITVKDAGASNAVKTVLLVAEEYMGRDSSFGKSRLHLYQTNGDPITAPDDPTNPSFVGSMNHGWSVATGDVDGLDTNLLLPYYPHNPGNEIILTQTTREFAHPASKLMIMRYRTGTAIQKPAPRNAFLNQLDTIVTTKITGWVAAVNDIDNTGDGKAEIFLADGNDLVVLHMRDYNDERFLTGQPFDTVFTHHFPSEVINHIAIADVDGDSLNDVLVTTNVRSYLFGVLSPNSLVVTTPSRITSGTTSFCRGDSASVTWYNVFRGQPAVRVKFQEYRNNAPYDTARVLAKSITNVTDTVSYKFLPDSLLAGKMGRFIIESTSTTSIKDSSAFVEFYAPGISFDTTIRSRRYTALSRGIVTGIMRCTDSLRLYYSLDAGKTWTYLDSLIRSTADTTFWFEPSMPCVLFGSCTSPLDTTITFKVEGYNKALNAVPVTSTISAKIIPAQITTRVYPEQTMLTSQRTILWLLPADSTICDSVMLLQSADGGKTFIPLAVQPRSQNEYEYHPDAQTSDTIIFRICCAASCYRTDTAIYNARSVLIHAVAPNPFDPTTDVCQIFSSPPATTTATVRIFDQSNHVIIELVNNELRDAGKVYTDTWNGMNDSGKFVAMGMYYIVIEFGDGSREFYPVFVRKK